jgi:hypothetical protein
MPLHHGPHHHDKSPMAVNPFYGEANPVGGMTDAPPKHRLPDNPMPPSTAYQLVHDELMLDGNARLNLATFVTTWMEPQAGVLMGECRDKNMIDKDEYPRTAELERRCVSMLAHLWNAPDADGAVGCSTTGSSEACMLAGMALKRRWMKRNADRYPSKQARPNLVMGINVQVCWEKFCNFWEVEARQVPMDGDRFHLDPQAAAELCDENTIGVVGILGSTFDGSYEPIEELCAALDTLQEKTGLDIPVHVDGASGGMIAPFIDPELVWDFRLPRVSSINTSGHKYGLVYPGVGWALWRTASFDLGSVGPKVVGPMGAGPVRTAKSMPAVMRVSFPNASSVAAARRASSSRVSGTPQRRVSSGITLTANGSSGPLGSDTVRPRGLYASFSSSVNVARSVHPMQAQGSGRGLSSAAGMSEAGGALYWAMRSCSSSACRIARRKASTSSSTAARCSAVSRNHGVVSRAPSASASIRRVS